MNQLTIISVMGGTAAVRDFTGNVREFAVQDIVARAMRGEQFETDANVQSALFKEFMNDLAR